MNKPVITNVTVEVRTGGLVTESLYESTMTVLEVIELVLDETKSLDEPDFTSVEYFADDEIDPVHLVYNVNPPFLAYEVSTRGYTNSQK